MPGKSDLPAFEKYFPPTVQSMKQRGGSATIEELEEDVAKIMRLPESILSVPHKNSTRSQFQYELAWVRTYLKKATLAANSSRAVWSLTPEGEKISDKELLLVPKKFGGNRNLKMKSLNRTPLMTIAPNRIGRSKF
jgi:restriction system protein